MAKVNAVSWIYTYKHISEVACLNDCRESVAFVSCIDFLLLAHLNRIMFGQLAWYHTH